MKKGSIFKKKYLSFVTILMIFFVTYGSAERVPNFPSKTLNDISTDLELSETQKESFRTILNIYNSQAILDRDTFKENSVALIEAAKRRLVMFDTGINSFLNDEQKMLFNSLKRDLVNEKELFILKEGLILTDTQIRQIGFILEEYNSRIDIIRERSGGIRGKPGNGKGSSVEGLMGRRGSGGRGGRGGMKGGGRSSYGPGDEINAIQSAKSKKIRALLTEIQKKLYKQLKKYISTKEQKGKKGF